VKASPLKYKAERSGRKRASNGARFDLDGDLVLAVDRVEVRHAVFAKKHADHDPKKSGNLRHERRASSVAMQGERAEAIS